MACLLVGTKPISDSMLEYCLLDPQEQASMKSLSQFIHFHSTKCIENVVWELSSILSWPQYVNAYRKRVWEGSTQHLPVCRDCWVRLIPYKTEHMPVKNHSSLRNLNMHRGDKIIVFADCWVQYQSVVALSSISTISHALRGNSLILQTPQIPSSKLLQDV